MIIKEDMECNINLKNIIILNQDLGDHLQVIAQTPQDQDPEKDKLLLRNPLEKV